MGEIREVRWTPALENLEAEATIKKSGTVVAAGLEVEANTHPSTIVTELDHVAGIDLAAGIMIGLGPKVMVDARGRGVAAGVEEMIVTMMIEGGVIELEVVRDIDIESTAGLRHQDAIVLDQEEGRLVETCQDFPPTGQKTTLETMNPTILHPSVYRVQVQMMKVPSPLCSWVIIATVVRLSILPLSHRLPSCERYPCQ